MNTDWIISEIQTRNVLVTYPIFWVQIQVLDLAMLEEAGQAHAVICEMRFLADDYDIVLSPFNVVFK